MRRRNGFSTGWSTPLPCTYQTTIHDGRQAKRLRIAEPTRVEVVAPVADAQDADVGPSAPALLEEHDSDYEDEDTGEAPPPGVRIKHRQRRTNTVSCSTSTCAQR